MVLLAHGRDGAAGLPTIFAFYSAYFSLSLPLPLNFGRPLVRTQKAGMALKRKNGVRGNGER